MAVVDGRLTIVLRLVVDGRLRIGLWILDGRFFILTIYRLKRVIVGYRLLLWLSLPQRKQRFTRTSRRTRVSRDELVIVVVAIPLVIVDA